MSEKSAPWPQKKPGPIKKLPKGWEPMSKETLKEFRKSAQLMREFASKPDKFANPDAVRTFLDVWAGDVELLTLEVERLMG